MLDEKMKLNYTKKEKVFFRNKLKRKTGHFFDSVSIYSLITSMCKVEMANWVGGGGGDSFWANLQKSKLMFSIRSTPLHINLPFRDPLT